MKSVDERFKSIHPHYFRHNWNQWFSEIIDKTMIHLKTQTVTVILFHLVKKQKAECIKWGTHQRVLPNHMLNAIFAIRQTS